MTFFIYAKRTAPESYDNINKTFIPQDKQFRAINSEGKRVSQLKDAIPFVTKEEAEEWLEEKIGKRGLKDGVIIEIRKKV